MENHLLGNKCRNCMGSGTEPEPDEEYQKLFPTLEIPPRCRVCLGDGRVCESCLGEGYVLRPNGDIDGCSDCEGSGEYNHYRDSWMDRL